ncbi:mitochondrial GTPase 1 [Anoplophora glabripennis]|uniref:mitochondrial GTPase 1 n=1 Tax=Anoplophora glabripennis TaxID=217634 RepID=UPI000873D287|nr:mitochondrial GTPase 1 [Anoplophora glabripennis]
MAGKIATETFRSTFKTIDKDVVRWFPGHMGRGLKQMQQKLRSVDCIVEVHDARIPLSGRNSDFKYTMSGIKPHILVLNKADLIENKFIDRITNVLSNEYEHILFTNCKNQKCRGVKQIFPLAQELINKSNRYNRSNEEDYNIMIIGVPNVGKSSLVNALRIRHLKKGKASHVGASPGITKSVLHKIKMCENPLFYMLDTPGILTPNINNVESGLKLTLCATIQDHLVGEKIVADYLLYWLNRQQHFEYVNYLKLDNPTDNILQLLTHISKQNGKTLKMKDYLNQYIIRPDLDSAAKYMLKAFRNGDLGKILLDEDLLE